MKNLIFTLLTIPILFLQSFTTYTTKDSVNQTTNNYFVDPILGTWTWYSENGKLLGHCDIMSTITFEEDGTFFNERYYKSDKTGECIYDRIYDTNNTWKVIKDNAYRLIDPEKDPTEYEDYTIVFSDNNRTMTMTLTYLADENEDGIEESHSEILILKKQ